MIAIICVGDGPLDGENTYRVQINKHLVTMFKHDRRDGLAECLRKAAEAVDLPGTMEAFDCSRQVSLVKSIIEVAESQRLQKDDV